MTDTPNTPTDSLVDSSQETTLPEKDTKPPPKGVDPEEWANDVDFSPKQQKRFNRLYAQIKNHEKVVGTLADDNRKLLDKIEELSRTQSLARAEDRISDLESRLEKAAEEGDIAEIKRLTNDIAETKIKAAGSAPAPMESPGRKTGADPAANPEQGFAPTEEQRLREWAYERDEEGDYLRPWSHPGHPRHQEFLDLAQKASSRVSSLEEGLAYVDEQMGDRPRANATVLSNSPSIRRNNRQQEITPEQRTIALRMFGPGTKPNMKPEDAIKRYTEAASKWIRPR